MKDKNDYTALMQSIAMADDKAALAKPLNAGGKVEFPQVGLRMDTQEALVKLTLISKPRFHSAIQRAIAKFQADCIDTVLKQRARQVHLNQSATAQE